MRLLLLISTYLIVGGSNSAAYCLPELPDETFFNAVVEVRGHTISGIMVIKKDEQIKNTCRILFTTVAGPKLMDMYITKDDYNILYVTKKLKKRTILGLFQKDFALVSGLYLAVQDKHCENGSCSVKLPKKKSAHYSFDAQNRISRAEYRGRGKVLLDVVYTYNQDNIESIFLQHYNFKMKITLNAINSTCQN
ncbi:MAG: hypothetical protein LBQ70_06730 [Prevotellaceae bacterium]|jgi:hypothetical protein|nr:hypothetical protein [Prevotellaceae bacterium]